MTKTLCETCNRTFKNHEALEHHNASKHSIPQKHKPNTKKIRNRIISAIVIAVLALLIIFPFISLVGGGKYDSFAQCLTDSGVKMYGAYWCPSCMEQKTLFGKSFKKINYIECSLPNRGGQNEVCNTAGIESYPTWEFSNGEKVAGIQQLTTLSGQSSCPLEKDE